MNIVERTIKITAIIWVLLFSAAPAAVADGFDPVNPQDPSSGQNDIENVLRGDINKDGIVDVGDIMAVINYMAVHSPLEEMDEDYDLNGDGVIDVGDIMTIINLMANSGHK